ncbi:MAG: TatD family hydrolase [Lysobacteraceae bacterium]
MLLIDSHCHIDAPEFDPDRAAVIARAHEAGVECLIAPAVDAASWPKLKAVAQAHPGVHPAYGLHPMFLSQHRPEHLAQLRDWIERERPCAVGECGLDHFSGDLDPDTQRDYLIGQLKLAREFALPLILHARKALDEVMALLRRFGSGGDGGGPALRGVVHSFSGSAQQAAQLYEMGFLVGIGGPVTHERAQRLRRIVCELPIEQLLLETDAPDQPDAAIRGQRNEPARLPHIAQVIATLRDEPLAHIAEQTSANARRLFGLPAAAEHRD